jgi:hypothetical protein
MDADDMHDEYEAPSIEPNHEIVFEGFTIRIWLKSRENAFIASAAIDPVRGPGMSLVVDGAIELDALDAMASALDVAKAEIRVRGK